MQPQQQGPAAASAALLQPPPPLLRPSTSSFQAPFPPPCYYPSCCQQQGQLPPLQTPPRTPPTASGNFSTILGDPRGGGGPTGAQALVLQPPPMTPRTAAAATATKAVTATTAAAAAAAALPLPLPSLPRPLLALSLMTAEAFLLAQAPFDAPLLFTVIRERSSKGGKRGGKASFRLLLEPKQAAAGAVAATAAGAGAGGNSTSASSSPRPLALARRRGRTLYSITPAGSSSPLALLKSNVWGTAYLATSLSAAERNDGGGGGKKKCGGGKEGAAAASSSEQLAAVSYRASSFLGPRGPRRLAALVPSFVPPLSSQAPAANAAPWPVIVGDGEGPAAVAAVPPRRPLAAAAAARDGSALTLSNVSPRWSASAGAFTLAFGGRVTAPSVKNFQLVAAGGDGSAGDANVPASSPASAASPASASASAAAAAPSATDKNDSNKIKNRKTALLQFGKTGRDSFSMDVRGPLTPLQGFLICLTALDGKLACE